VSRLTRILTLAVLVAVMVVIGLDIASPLVLERKLASSASAVARAAEDAYFQTGSAEKAGLAARGAAADRGVVLTHFEVLTAGGALVTVADTAESYELGRFGPLHHFYEVDATATAGPRAGAPPTSTTKAG
jgi:hypothetical protein